MRAVRYGVLIVLAYVLAYSLDYGSVFIHRQDFDRAVDAWVKNPTAENQAALDRERHINHLVRMHDSAIAAAIEVGLIWGLWTAFAVYGKRKRSSERSS